MQEPQGRRTRQKKAVMTALQKCNDFISAQDMYQLLRDEGCNIGLATIYRQLNDLADQGVLDTVQLHSQQLFRLCDGRQGREHSEGSDHHHHHLICQKCNKTIEIDAPYEAWLERLANEHHFVVTSHTFEVFGLCDQCVQSSNDE